MKKEKVKLILFNIIFTILVCVIVYISWKKDQFVIDLTFDNLNSVNENILTREVLNQNDISTSAWDNNLETNAKIREEINGNKYLAIYSPKGSYGPKNSGIQVEIELEPGNEYYMSYDMMFDDDFSFGSQYRGGKLPGLTAGNRCENECDGTDGFASRFMWRKAGEGELYLCNVDKKSEYCDDYYFKTNDSSGKFKFEKGTKYNISEYVRLNSGPENYDGQIIVMIDNEEVLNLENIRLVTNEDQIDTFYLSMFFGGSSPLWSASNDSYFYMDNIYIEKIS